MTKVTMAAAAKRPAAKAKPKSKPRPNQHQPKRDDSMYVADIRGALRRFNASARLFAGNFVDLVAALDAAKAAGILVELSHPVRDWAAAVNQTTPKVDELSIQRKF